MSRCSHHHQFFNTDAISWYHIDLSFIIGDKIARKKVKPIFNDRGQPGFFKEIVLHWVAFDLVQIFHRCGLKPTFNESLHEWSQDLYSLVMVLGKNEPTTEDKEQAERCLSTLFDVTITEHWASFPRTEFGTKQNFKIMPNFAIPLVILTWNRMLQEYFSKDSENTFFGLGNYHEQKAKNKDAPYDNMYMSGNDCVEFKVESFSCFQPNETLESSPDVCPSLLQWAEYLLTPAIKTDNQKIDRLQKLREKPMVRYNMTHTTMKLRPPQDKTVDVVATSSEALANEVTTTAGAMPEVVHMNSEAWAEEARAEATTSSNALAEEEPTTKNTPSVLLLYRIGEALQAAKRTHDSIKRKGPGLGYNEAKVNGGIASLVQWVQSINQEENMLDFEGAMDWLEREFKKGNSLVIDLTKLGEEGTCSEDSSVSSTHDSDGSDYKEGGDGSKLRHKKTTSRKKQKTPDKGNSP
jgi:hypothetical protein